MLICYTVTQPGAIAIAWTGAIGTTIAGRQSDRVQIMFSLNVPLPPAVEGLAMDLHPKLSGFDRVRERHTLVCKRFGVEDVADIVGTGGVEGVADAVSGSGGVDPERPRPPKPDALVRLHRRLCAAYDAVEGIEDDAYVPHITLARGGEPNADAVDRVLDISFDTIRWRTHALDLYDPEFREVAATVNISGIVGVVALVNIGDDVVLARRVDRVMRTDRAVRRADLRRSASR